MSILIRRYSDRMRINHWIVALLFICAGLTGLAIFHRSLFFLSALFGGGAWNRILHPYFGVLMVIGFVFLFAQAWRDNLWTRGDSTWMRQSPELLKGHEENMPPVGKYNAGQKLVFWIFGICLLLLFVTGFVFWRPWFAPYFSIELRRVAVLVHAIAATVLILTAIVHIYAGIWVKGSVRSMTRGFVTENWARHHHLLWYRELGGEK